MKIGAMARFNRNELTREQIMALEGDLILKQRSGEKFGFGSGQNIVLYREVADSIDVPRQYAVRQRLGSNVVDETVEGVSVPIHFKGELRPAQVPLVDHFLTQIGIGEAKYGGIFSAPCGCHAKGEPILMADGTRRKAEDVRVGDDLMGIDGPRRVLELHRGRQQMARVIPKKGTPFVVNVGHILTVLWSVSDGARKDGDVIDVTVAEWLTASRNFQRHTVLYRPRVDVFKVAVHGRHPIDPYHLGILLGDGTLTKAVGVTTDDVEVVEECGRLAASFGLVVHKDEAGSRCPTYRINSGVKFYGKNRLAEALDGMGLLNHTAGGKFIPHVYLVASRADRMKLLAGLIDTEGCVSGGGFDWISKSKRLAGDMVFLCRSLGLAAYSKSCKKRSQNGKVGTYHRVSISGDCSVVPTRIPRKRAPKRRMNKDVQRVGFKIKLLPENDYYGFVVGGDHRYLMGDFTWTHNTGKTVMTMKFLAHIGKPALVLVHTGALVKQWKESIVKFTDVRPWEIGHIQQKVCDWKGKKIVVAMIESVIRREYEPEMYRYFGVVVLDECVTGDSLIHTDRGLIPIRLFPLYSPGHVLSFNELLGKWEYRRLVRWIPRGVRRTLRIRAGELEIRCTPEHLFLTKGGQVKAGNLRLGMRVLSPVPAGVENSSRHSTYVGDRYDLLGGITPKDTELIVRRGAFGLSRKPRAVLAGVRSASGFSEDLRESDCLLHAGRSISPATICAESSGDRFPRMSLDSSTERYLAIRTSGVLTPLRSPGYPLLMEQVSGSGQSIRLDGLLVLESGHELRKIVGLGSGVVLDTGPATPDLKPSSELLSARGRSLLSGSGESQRRGGLGFTWMTDRVSEAGSRFTPRTSQEEIMRFLRNSCEGWGLIQGSEERGEDTFSCICESQTPFGGSNDSGSSVLPEWGTNFLTITEIIEDPKRGEEEVFDLEVEGNHNFVANGFLVHNCHRHGAVEWHRAILQFPARIRIGLSATPRRWDGLWDVVRHHVGEVLTKAEGHEVKPKVYCLTTGVSIPSDVFAMRGGRINLALMINLLVGIEGRNCLIVAEASKALKVGRRVLILSDRLQHLADLKKMFEESWKREPDETVRLTIGHYVGGMTHDQIDYAKTCNLLLGTMQYAKEGLDDPGMDTLFLTVPKGDVEQPVGRILRSCEGKKEPLVIDLVDDRTGPCVGFARARRNQYARLGFDVFDVDCSIVPNYP